MELSGKGKSFYFTKGNRKLSKNILIWNLPHPLTCRGSSKQCRAYCYENKIVRMYPQVQKARLRNLEFSKRKDFAKQIIRYLEKRKENIIRIFEAGDFYSQKHLDDWKTIARTLKDKTFYCYTKAFDLDLWTNLPKNFKIIQSFGSRFDHLIDKTKSTSRVIESEEELKEGEHLCPFHREDFTACGECCKECMTLNKITHVAFLKH